ncbi:sensor histidine kinase [Intestinimonas butyriciproducens]|uniref:histidine kinase n=1 Tax=Intestinimonas butyriciproducens TaxID=1297617 RepID=A0A0S2W140_9FIRM|nr:HAMP domain-containing sensor histidine kinase [Intestinimonas butyriciproducens]ALP93053.1 hypothetical protein IB211_00658c [Intestinimonas butyriciproducens]
MHKLFWTVFLRTAAVFLAFWALMAGVISFRSLDAREASLRAEIRETLDWNLMNCQLVLEGTAAAVEKPALLADRMAACSPAAGSMGVFRIYDLDGTELARSPLTSGYFSLPGTGVYDYFLHFDPVLTDDEQLALARLLRADKDLCAFYGTEGGLYGESDVDRPGLYGEVTGVVEHNVVYPQKLVYYFADGPLTLLDTDSAYFEGKTLTTLAFDAARLQSPLIWSDDPPKLALQLFRQAQARVDSLVGSRGPSAHWAGTMEGGAGYAHCGTVAPYDGLISAYGAAYRPLRLATHGLGLLYGSTFFFALLLAVLVARSQSRSLRRERDLTNAVAHELKTPLALVRSYAEGLSEDIAPEKREEYLSVIVEESDRMAALVGSLLDLSRLESGRARFQPVPVELDQVVRDVLRPLERPARKKGITLSPTLEPCTLSGDREQLTRLVGNLASNALRHCAPGGEVRFLLRVEKGSALLRVENDGDPIPPEVLPRLFEPFYKADPARTRTQGGTGLGLALVQEITALHGGRCGADSLASGAAFWCTFPICQAPDSMV